MASRATDHGGEQIVARLVPQIMEVDVPVVQVHLGRPLDKVVDMLVIVNDSGLQWCVMGAMKGFFDAFASFFALLRLSRS